MAGTQSTSARGEIITFYSYKGGTGRTMALANVACLVAERLGPGERVLVADWDLEAPGLHRFLPPRLVQQNAAIDLGLDATAGVIDLFTALRDALSPEEAASEDASDAAVKAAFSSINFESFMADTSVAGVSILRAGRNDDGQYSRRVNTFNWEGLFRRAPTIYRAFAERLCEMFRYVLIDSRTGVTDISGICTSLLPEKLVVVFTPNRQSLTGVRELVERATTYRRNSDDLRPLLVHPLPSRIEASLQDLRALWRFGSRDHNIVGYQPMFEDLLAKAYGLSRCDLSAYFDEVQIQQTPDYAYGEEIAVRRTSDRFSLANSYRVFVDRLVSGAPPWARHEELAAAASANAPAHDSPVSSDGSVVISISSSPPQPSAPPIAEPATVVSKGGRPKVFLSYAREDRERVARIAVAFKSRGFDVWWDHSILAAGVEFSRAVEEALDSSDVVVVCWSRDSITSEWVRAEAEEGLRRGVLIPVLMDDVSPPLTFRSIQSADIRRDVEGGIERLVDAVAEISRRSPGTGISQALPMSPLKPSARNWGLRYAAGAGIALLVGGVSIGWLTKSPFPSGSVMRDQAPPGSNPTATEGIRVPTFIGSETADVRKAASYLDLEIAFKDERGTEASSLEGVVIEQSPRAGQLVARGTTVQLTVTGATVVVPTVVGATLDSAVLSLSRMQLRLGTTESLPVGDVKPGMIVAQSPAAGMKVAAGSQVNVTVATPARLERPRAR